MSEDTQVQNEGAVDLESMSTEQVEQHLDKQSAAPANEQAPANQQVEGGQEGAQGPAPDPMSIIQRRLDEMHREMGRFRGFQSHIDKLPQTVEQSVAKILEQRERQAYLNSLPPEERQASNEAQQREQAFRDHIRKETVSALQEQFPGQLQFIEQAMEAQKDQALLANTSRMAEQVAPGSSQRIASLFEQNYRDLNSQDPAVVRQALEWNEKATQSPEFLVLELVKSQSQAARQGAQSYTNAKAVEARASGQVLRPGQNAPAGRKPLAQYTTSELEAMSTEELEKLVP